jgi:AcrR family transcriptional regulator
MAVQQRTLKTRAKLLEAAQARIDLAGYEALRVEDVVKDAGVAKGTFFAHFKDKDALMDHLVGSEIHRCLDDLELLPTPKSVDEILNALGPSFEFMTRERFVFDVILRYSGAANHSEIGVIAQTFIRHGTVLAHWLSEGPFRKDIDPVLMAEGVGAFQIQALALHFCEAHNSISIRDRMEMYLNAWLLPTPSG